MDIFGAIMLGDQFQMSQSQNVTKKKSCLGMVARMNQSRKQMK